MNAVTGMAHPMDATLLQRLCQQQTAYIAKLESSLLRLSERAEIVEQRAELVHTAHDFIRNALRLTPEDPLRFDFYAQRITELVTAQRAAEAREAAQREQIAALQAQVEQLTKLDQSHRHFREGVAKLMRHQQAYEASLGQE